MVKIKQLKGYVNYSDTLVKMENLVKKVSKDIKKKKFGF